MAGTKNNSIVSKNTKFSKYDQYIMKSVYDEIVCNCVYSLFTSKFNSCNINMLPEVAGRNTGLAISTPWVKNTYS